MKAVLAIDIGGTKIRSGLVAADGMVLHAETSLSLAHKGASEALAQMCDAVQGLQLYAANASITIHAIGISAAGAIDSQSGVVVSATDAIPNWAGTNLAAFFSQGLELECAVDNDARCALIGELWRGASVENAKDAPVVMITLGTGLGGAMLINKQVLAGAHLLAGHLGRTLVWDNSMQRYCPLEHLVSGTGLLNIYAQLPDAKHYPLADGHALITAIENGNEHGNGPVKALALEALRLWVDHLARAIVNLSWLLDPRQIIIGGGVIQAKHLWWDKLVAAIAKSDLPTKGLVLSPAALGNDAGMIGAAKLAWQKVDGAQAL
jgi:glucokinase